MPDEKITSLSDEEYLRTFLTPTKHRPLGRIAFDERVLVRSLPRRVDKVARALIDRSAAEAQVDDSMTHEINLLYSLYHAFQQGESHPKLEGLRESLASFPAFMRAYGPERTPEEQRNLISRIGRFSLWSIGERRYRYVYASLGQREYDYSSQGSWCRIGNNSDTVRHFVAEPVVNEIRERGTSLASAQQGMVFHATGSAALDGLTKQSALLSAYELLKRGETPVSGEYVTGVDSSSSGRGLRDIYADHSVTTGYHTVRWFDEFPVTFGLSREGLQTHAANTGQQINIKYWGENGWRIGTEAPLSLIKQVYVPHMRQDEIASWRDQNCPDASIVSLEAATESYWVQKAIESDAVGAAVVR